MVLLGLILTNSRIVSNFAEKIAVFVSEGFNWTGCLQFSSGVWL
jgi:hypothetical protein